MTVLEAITKIIDQRKKDRRVPHCAMRREVADMVGLTENEVWKQALKLKKEGKIAIKDTINSKSFYLK